MGPAPVSAGAGHHAGRARECPGSRPHGAHVPPWRRGASRECRPRHRRAFRLAGPAVHVVCRPGMEGARRGWAHEVRSDQLRSGLPGARPASVERRRSATVERGGPADGAAWVAHHCVPGGWGPGTPAGAPSAPQQHGNGGGRLRQRNWLRFSACFTACARLRRRFARSKPTRRTGEEPRPAPPICREGLPVGEKRRASRRGGGGTARRRRIEPWKTADGPGEGNGPSFFSFGRAGWWVGGLRWGADATG